MRTPQELWQALDDQKRALASSGKGYDSGGFWEAPRLATAVYNVVNDGSKKTVSILSQLGVRGKARFLSSKPPHNPGNLFKSGAPLCIMRLKMGGEEPPFGGYVPRLDNGAQQFEQWLPFKDWWEESIYQNVAGAHLSRMNLVFSLRSKDGGSHLDREIPRSPYLDMIEQVGEGFVQDVRGEMVTRSPVKNAHLATMRQIAWELERSLEAIQPPTPP